VKGFCSGFSSNVVGNGKQEEFMIIIKNLSHDFVNFAIPLIIKQAFGQETPSNLSFSDIPISLPIICVVICFGVTIVSGLRPAQRATKVDVLKAMRREI
jgi:ABC-type lipoprotein release transport system permease subunit